MCNNKLYFHIIYYKCVIGKYNFLNFNYILYYIDTVSYYILTIFSAYVIVP